MAIPDFVVNKVNTEQYASSYPALIELTTRTIEVYEESVYQTMYEAACFWEAAIWKQLGIRGENVNVKIVVSCF